MKKIKKLPTLIGLIVLIISLGFGVFFINSRQNFRLGAQAEALPSDVKITNLTQTSFTVSWTTSIPTSGFVKWGVSEKSIQKIASEERTGLSLTHHITVTNIETGSQFFFKINSNNSDWDNNGTAWSGSTNTSGVSGEQQFFASGTIVDEKGNPLPEALIYLMTDGYTLSTLTSENGSWIIPVSSYVDIQDVENTLYEISIIDAKGNSSSAVIYAGSASQTPSITINKSYDFRSFKPSENGGLPESSVQVPVDAAISSRFEITSDSLPSNKNNVSLTSIEEGETINTTTPEFFGKSPKNLDIEIIVESELQSAVVVPDINGDWKWAPPSGLSPGEHKVTIKWKDTSGIIRAITRNFYISAAEGLAFEATPSATPIESPTASPVQTAEPSNSPSPLANETPAPPVPDTGVLTPTLGLFIMGMGILLASIYVWSKEYAQ